MGSGTNRKWWAQHGSRKIRKQNSKSDPKRSAWLKGLRAEARRRASAT